MSTGKPARHKRGDKTDCTQVVLSENEKIRFQNDIFVLHGAARFLLNRMEAPGAYENDIAGRDIVALKINRDESAALLDHNQFDFRVPVGGNLGEIERNRAQICGIGEIRGSVRLRFMIVLIFIEIHSSDRAPFRESGRNFSSGVCPSACTCEEYRIMIVLYNKMKVFCKKYKRKRTKMQYRRLQFIPFP